MINLTEIKPCRTFQTPVRQYTKGNTFESQSTKDIKSSLLITYKTLNLVLLKIPIQVH